MDSRICSAAIILCGFFLFAGCETLEDDALNFRALYLEDINNQTILYNRLLDEESALAGLKTTMRQELKAKNAQMLTNVMSGNDTFITQVKTKELITYFIQNYDRQLSEDILYDGLNDLYSVKTPYQILVLLSKIFPEDSEKGFEMMICSHLQLFELYNLKKRHEDFQFLSQFAFSLNNFRNRLASTMSPSAYLKSKIDEIITKLPNNLQYLLFQPHFCLQNAGNKEYIFIATSTSYDMDSTTRRVYTWYENRMDSPGYIKANVFNSDSENRSMLLVELVGVKSGYKYYMLQPSNIIVAWKLSSDPLNYLFDIEFLDGDRVVLSQHGYAVCSAEKRDKQRREVKTYLTEGLTKPECQWNLGVCKR